MLLLLLLPLLAPAAYARATETAVLSCYRHYEQMRLKMLMLLLAVLAGLSLLGCRLQKSKSSQSPLHSMAECSTVPLAGPGQIW